MDSASCKTSSGLSCIMNVIASADQVVQDISTSTAMVLAKFILNVPTSTLKCEPYVITISNPLTHNMSSPIMNAYYNNS